MCEFADICIISMKTAIKGLFLNFRYRNWLFYIIFLLLGLTVGFYGNSLIQPQGSAFLSDDIQRQRGNFKLVNPILDCSVNTDVKSSKLGQLKEKTQELIDSLKEQNLATHISVYYRDLISRQWFGIDEKVGFTPASLLKVPVMMVYFKKAETDPSVMQKKLLVTADRSERDQMIAPSEVAQKGKSYTVEELIHLMIVRSDNIATELLLSNINMADLSRLYEDLDIKFAPKTPDLDDLMNVKDYASFFRILYNASYLTPEMSEKALSILLEDDFDDGLRAGIPQAVPLANKFGEREVEDIRQLHDCGIVYSPGRPYILCVMTRGSDLVQLSGVIKDISSVVYQEVSSQVKAN